MIWAPGRGVRQFLPDQSPRPRQNLDARRPCRRRAAPGPSRYSRRENAPSDLPSPTTPSSRDSRGRPTRGRPRRSSGDRACDRRAGAAPRDRGCPRDARRTTRRRYRQEPRRRRRLPWRCRRARPSPSGPGLRGPAAWSPPAASRWRPPPGPRRRSTWTAPAAARRGAPGARAGPLRPSGPRSGARRPRRRSPRRSRRGRCRRSRGRGCRRTAPC